MKITKLGFLSLFACLLLFTNCEQEQALAVEIAEPSEEQLAENYLLRAQHLVLFAALEVNHETYSAEGFIIDKHANLRKVEMESRFLHKFERASMSDDAMRELYAKSTVVEKLDLIETATMLKNAYRLADEEVAAVGDETLQTSKVYYGFKRNNNYEAEESCSPGYYDHGPTNLQVLIHAEGRLSGENSATTTTEVLNWLRGFEGEEEQGK